MPSTRRTGRSERPVPEESEVTTPAVEIPAAHGTWETTEVEAEVTELSEIYRTMV
jgi:hypothetical protein